MDKQTQIENVRDSFKKIETLLSMYLESKDIFLIHSAISESLDGMTKIEILKKDIQNGRL